MDFKGKKILNSRGEFTLEVRVGDVKASVPSGASKGKEEAFELKDIDKAVANVEKIIGPSIKDIGNQEKVDRLMIKLDGTKNKSRLGANAILGVSLAVCRLGAEQKNIPLYKYIGSNRKMPVPCFNILNGGKHAKNRLAIQEFMVIPQAKTFKENFKIGKKAYNNLKNLLGRTALGDEGGFSPRLKTQEALEFVKKAGKGCKIGLDCAASHFFKNNKYHIDGLKLSRKELLQYYKELIKKYPIVFLEDPFRENDWHGFSLINKGRIDIIGDDLLATNVKRMKKAYSKKACNGMILKVNQIGTVTEAIEASVLAKSFNWKTIVSHRSGETTDDFIADFAVGIGADFIKAGAPATKERMAKYNRLLEIEKNL